MNLKQIGRNIAQLRKGKVFTQESLAEKLGISPQAVSKWETGSGLPEASVLVALSSIFEVPVDEILQVCSSRGLVQDFADRNRGLPAKKLLNN